MTRKIIHIDMDAFYASVEQRDDPALRGKPVAVGGSSRRGVVAAASYEARRFGIHSAMPSVTAARKCAELVFVKPRFDVYKQVSRQIRAIFHDYTPLVEPLSLDEAYLDVTDNIRQMPSATTIALEIRARILKETGLTASAGISYNKFLAKLASDQNKPNGQFVIAPGKGEEFIAALPVGKFHGVGPATAAKMNRLGIFTGADLKERSPSFLNAHFGKSGGWYHAIARGEDERRVVSNRQRKSIGSETTFFDDLEARSDIEASISAIADEVAAHCEKACISGRTVTVKVKYADFQQITRSRTVTGAIRNRRQLEPVALDLIGGIFPLGKKIRLLGVTLSNLDVEAPHAVRQLDLGLG
ncbi:DNA polymerase IV [Iodidimonas sp. SYSU 1G8]|uniref:DNA polymerase IV n=1 Tax=Iodidimonas sp. SYSU 1G8 TaxID=3133967 RepID=UPI0031FF112C